MLSLPFHARTRGSANVPRTALHRPHSILVSSGAFTRSVILIDRLPHSQQTALKPDCSAMFCCAEFIVLTLPSAADHADRILTFGPWRCAKSNDRVRRI